MIPRIIEACARHRLIVVALVAAALAWAGLAVRRTPLDALPDLSDPQVIVFTDWMGRSPDLIEDQITYPLVRGLQSTPNVKAVRGYSMFGMSFIYVIFPDGTDLYWARTRVVEQIGRAQGVLPPGTSPVLGPDATGVGWVYQYVLQDRTGKLDLAQLRELQDFTVRPALQAVPGIAEVASLGGFERQYQIILDPNRLAALGLSPADVRRAVQDANSEVGARVLEMGGREYLLRGRGYVQSLADLESAVVRVGGGGTPLLLSDVATVQFGPEIRRGSADLNGAGEVVGGIAVMRIGANALEVIERLKAEITQLALPAGVELTPTYDRSELIRGAMDTLEGTLAQEAIIVVLVCLVFLFHLRSALIPMIVLPVSVTLAFIPMYHLGLTSNIMSLGGIAIAIGELADASIVLIENAHVRLAAAPPGSDRKRIIIDAAKEVGTPIFFSLLLITVSFLPIFTLAGQAGRLFSPLAYTKTFAMFAAAILSITLAPPLMVWLLRGRFRREEDNPVSRLLTRLYRPVAGLVVRRRGIVVGLAALLIAATVPVFLRLGSEFMPPLDEGSLLVMPTTFPGISIEEARRVLQMQDRIIKGFSEVASVHGKAGRAETATDPAGLDMIETVVALRPRDVWPEHWTARWYSHRAPDWLKALLAKAWPEWRRWTLDELSQSLDHALRMPGFQMAIAPPIRTRIDMLSTGVRTPVGIKVFGPSLDEIERLGLELEGVLREVPGTRSIFAERQTGREYIDIVPDRRAIARYGLTVREVNEIVEIAVGGMPVSTVIAGRARFSVNLRYGSAFRGDPEALRSLLVPIPPAQPASEGPPSAAGAGGSTSQVGAMAASGGGMGPMGPGPAPSAGDSMSGPDDGGRGAGAMRNAAGGTTANGPLGAASLDDPSDRFMPLGTTVPLGALADVRVVTGPPMIKDEGGVLTGYVFADIDGSKRDLGGWVKDAKRQVAERVVLPAGYRLAFTGQYEFLAEMESRLRVVLPITLLLITVLIFLALRGWAQTFLVLLSLPFAVAGSIWLFAALGYHLSTAAWVGIIAVAGVAAQTGIVMIVFLDEAYTRAVRDGRLRDPAAIDQVVVEGASRRVRPVLMTVATTVLGLLPLLWQEGVGADVSARTAAPVVGGLVSCSFLTLLVLPAAYTFWRRRQLERQLAPAGTQHDVSAESSRSRDLGHAGQADQPT
jgi:Cu(I)/Ag(I) efflux system membrane protein CusA/SilA